MERTFEDVLYIQTNFRDTSESCQKIFFRIVFRCKLYLIIYVTLKLNLKYLQNIITTLS